MKNKLLKLLRERKEIYITELLELMPEIKGEYSIYMPVKEGFNPNILWMGNVTQEFIILFNELLNTDRIIKWEPTPVFHHMFMNKPIYTNVPVATPALFKSSKKECWMPIIIKESYQQKIQEAYGTHWEVVKNSVNDTGWCNCYYTLTNNFDVEFYNYYEHNKLSEWRPISLSFIPKMCIENENKPICLNPISDNNLQAIADLTISFLKDKKCVSIPTRILLDFIKIIEKEIAFTFKNVPESKSTVIHFGFCYCD